MERLSVVMAVCLLVGLSECQTGGEDNQNEIPGLTHEDLADPRVEKDALQNLTTLQSWDPTTAQMELEALQDKLAANMRALEETKEKLTVLEINAENQGRNRIAFSASLSIDGTIGPVNIQYPLVYNHVLSNIGGRYSPISGYFTAPVLGVYYFTFNSLWWGGEGTSGGSLLHNGKKIVSWSGHSLDHTVSGSNSAILLLKVGDNVNVQLWENTKISNNPNNYSTFSGFLLFPL